MTSPATELRIYETLLLLALRDEKGTFAHGTWPAQAIAGGLLAELSLEGRVRIPAGGGLLEVTSEAPLGDPLLDETLTLIATSRKPRSLSKWLSRLAGRGCLSRRAKAGLLERGILHVEMRRFLGLIPRRRTPLADVQAKQRILERLAAALGDTSRAPDTRTILTLSLAQSTGILKRVLDPASLRDHRARLEELVGTEAVGAAARRVVKEIEAAILVAAIVPAIAS